VVGAGANLREVDFSFAQPDHPAFIRLKLVDSSTGSPAIFPRFTTIVRRLRGAEASERPDLVLTRVHRIEDDVYRIGPLTPGPYEVLVESECSDTPPTCGPTGRATVDIPERNLDDATASNEIDAGIVRVRGGMKVLGQVQTPLPLARYLQGQTKGPAVSLQSLEGSPWIQIGVLRNFDDWGSSINTSRTAGRAYSAPLAEDGSFSIWGVVPGGRYRVQVSGLPPNLLLESATYGSNDVLEADLLLTHDLEATLDLSMATADTLGTVTGSVRAIDGKPAAESMVVLIPPADRRSNLAAFRTAIVDQAGGFTISGILPGDYQVVAWQDMKPGAFLDPKILATIDDRFSRVFVRRGSRNVMDLEAIPPER
jgi:hypothetical protein